MCFKPVVAGTRGNLKRHGTAESPAHQPCHKLLQLRQFVRHYIEHKFVVNLHHHTRTQSQTAHLLMDAYHGYLDYIGRRTLQRGVDGIPFGITAHCGIT